MQAERPATAIRSLQMSMLPVHKMLQTLRLAASRELGLHRDAQRATASALLLQEESRLFALPASAYAAGLWPQPGTCATLCSSETAPVARLAISRLLK